jgi:ribonuclease HI
MALWNAMRETWNIPALKEVKNTGTEWLLHMMDKHDDITRAMILTTFWRIWHVRNEVVHLKPAPSIESSKHFLCSYMDSLRQHPHADVTKGKMVVQYPGEKQTEKHQKERKRDEPTSGWQAPPPRWVKLNVDGSYMQEGEVGGAGMVLRNTAGEFIFSACRYLSTCTSALEAEIAALMEGIALANQWSNLPVIVETDASEVVRLVLSGEGDRSSLSALVGEIKHLIMESVEVKVVHIKRDQNIVSHTLAAFGRRTMHSALWLGSGPDNIPTLCRRDCNTTV